MGGEAVGGAAGMPALPMGGEGGAPLAPSAGAGGEGGSSSELPAIDCDPIVFTDAQLEQAVRDALDKPTGDIVAADVADLKILDARGYGVELLNGIECLSGLTQIDLGMGGAPSNVTELSPLLYLQNLLSLDLSNCPLDDLTPLGQLASLTKLDLRQSIESGVDLAPLAAAPALVELALQSTELGDLSPLGQIDTLHTLHLSFATLSDPASAAQLKQIKELRATGVFSDATPLGALTQLELLEVRNKTLANASALSPLVNLTHLDVRSTGITSAAFVSAMTKLTYLSLASNQVSDLAPLQGLSALQTLHLNQNPVASLTPLASNTGIATGDSIFLTAVGTLNCQNEAANIATITGRGATIVNNPCP
jgi:Leucine-rich repeat (LRR) protein